MSHSYQTSSDKHQLTQNIFEWTNSDVCKFFQVYTSKKQLDITKLIQKHSLIGIDLIDLNEQNLNEIGIQTIHDRKNILRQIKYLKNQSNSNYGIIKVYFKDNNNFPLCEVKIKVCDSQTKVKHIIRQAFQFFQQKKCDLAQYCLVQINQFSQDSLPKIPLANDTSIHALILGNKIEEFEIIKSQDIIQISTTQPSTISSPLRSMKKNLENSLEKLISSPTQTIYVQRIEENEDIVQLNSSGSEIHIKNKTGQQNQRNSSRSTQKSKININVKAKTIGSNNSNSAASTGRESTQIIQSSSNYLQNYITSNKQSHKKQNSSQLSHFQQKKHSVNDYAFNYNNQLQNVTGNQPSNNQNSGFNSLSRGNSMQKMKTFSVNSGTKITPSTHPSQPMFHNSTKTSGNKDKLKSSQKGKSMNMYQTMNGDKGKPKRDTKHDSIGNSGVNYKPVLMKENSDQQTQQQTPIQHKPVLMEQNTMSDRSKNGCGSFKSSSFVNNQQITLSQFQDNKQINNLNDIFSDFLDEQSTTGKPIKKSSIKARAESSHSRQQVLLEEDSLENTAKCGTNTYHQYLQTENQQSLYDPFNQKTLSKDMVQSQNNLVTQRAVKHMAHKSMYALNSHQTKINNQKRQQYVNNQLKNCAQLYGTFDHSSCSSNQMQQMNVSENQILKENYNINNVFMNQSKQAPVSQRIDTDINDILNKENIVAQFDNYDCSGLGKRGGTMHSKPYGVRSDSNGPKHKNNRYSENTDDLLMIDMSEEDESAVLIK